MHTSYLYYYKARYRPHLSYAFLIFLYAYISIYVYTYTYTYPYTHILIYQTPFAIRSTVDGTREVTAGHVTDGQPSRKVPGCFWQIRSTGCWPVPGLEKKVATLGLLPELDSSIGLK